MSRIEGHLARCWPPPPACRVPPPPRAPCPGLRQHRLAERPLLTYLLEHLPGSVPFSTHLELENARSRLVDRARGDTPETLQPRPPAHSEGRGVETTSCRAADGRPAAARSSGTRRARKVLEPATIYVLRRERWPLGGLIDLVI